MAGKPLELPPIESVTVAAVLHAPADPVRLAIVRALQDAEPGSNCVATSGRQGIVLPKSTCSQHDQILRDAGLCRCERRGVEPSSRLRLDELEGRFPGLVAAILEASRAERGAPGGGG